VSSAMADLDRSMPSGDDRIAILLVEDSPGDARLLQEFLAESDPGRFAVTCVETLAQAMRLAGARSFDVMLLDLSLPDDDGLDTFFSAHARAPSLPIVVLTGLDDAAVALKAIQAGAQDYLVKGQIDGQLVARAVRYAIERSRLQIEQTRLIHELETALTRVKTLQGLLPICASCKKIRDDKGYWNQIESYLREHTNADFTHGICPECSRRLYAGFMDRGVD